MRACVASILELPIEECPNPHGTGWWQRWLDWLEEYGLTFVHVGEAYWFPGYWIACVKSPRGDYDHAVVYKGEKMVWDPHPERHPCGPPLDTTMIVPLDPARGMLT
jgi:hypothetical protein